MNALTMISPPIFMKNERFLQSTLHARAVVTSNLFHPNLSSRLFPFFFRLFLFLSIPPFKTYYVYSFCPKPLRNLSLISIIFSEVYHGRLGIALLRLLISGLLSAIRHYC